MSAAIPSLCSLFLMSSSSSSSSASPLPSSPSVAITEEKSVAELLVEWRELVKMKGGKSIVVAAISSYLASKTRAECADLWTQDQAISVMVDCICSKFVTGELNNRHTRIKAIQSALSDAVSEVEVVSGEEEEEEEEGEDLVDPERKEVDAEREEKKEELGLRSPPRASRSRKAKQSAADRKVALDLHDRSLVGSFARRASKLKSVGMKKVSGERSGPVKRIRNSSTRHKQSSRSRVELDLNRSSDDDSMSGSDSSSSSSHGVRLSAFYSDQDDSASSVSDSESDDEFESGRHSHGQVHFSRGELERVKTKESYGLARYMWNKSHGHVKRALMKRDYKNKRNEYEVMILGKLFDVLMTRENAALHYESVRIIAKRITALQAFEITGNWQVSDQFGEDAIHNGLVSRKTLSKAVKKVGQLAKVVKEAAPTFTPRSNPKFPPASSANRPQVPPMLHANPYTRPGNYANQRGPAVPPNIAQSGPGEQ